MLTQASLALLGAPSIEPLCSWESSTHLLIRASQLVVGEPIGFVRGSITDANNASFVVASKDIIVELPATLPSITAIIVGPTVVSSTADVTLDASGFVSLLFLFFFAPSSC
jgi:hypothetical protein